MEKQNRKQTDHVSSYYSLSRLTLQPFISRRHSEVGKVVGGTKGNPVLEFISGAPNKAIIIEDEPNIFDYDQLTKYGFDVSIILVDNGLLFLSSHHDVDSSPLTHITTHSHVVSGNTHYECGWTS